jgi:hypothetical protein
MSKIQYFLSTSAIFIISTISTCLAFFAYDKSGLTEGYGFLSAVPITSLWAFAQHKLKDAYKAARR